ncbi:uncharacterized protein EV422DRAFT_544186 [Fimicolochytrium jonesii]|uniref:uncharacterized protein n=1 Tax=Fimicolochytrium jonesii TaxID=1396493 RepID=UPI0022FEC26D|nr:uncharacterized protein EV422DRAFT_544186 [Fimicolochytrium jonesii]KAI8816840.1 hypothetical protein EV422DRAFT_544186 [Fimicolochytrium jonesii]
MHGAGGSPSSHPISQQHSHFNTHIPAPMPIESRSGNSSPAGGGHHPRAMSLSLSPTNPFLLGAAKEASALSHAELWGTVGAGSLQPQQQHEGTAVGSAYRSSAGQPWYAAASNAATSPVSPVSPSAASPFYSYAEPTQSSSFSNSPMMSPPIHAQEFDPFADPQNAVPAVSASRPQPPIQHAATEKRRPSPLPPSRLRDSPIGGEIPLNAQRRATVAELGLMQRPGSGVSSRASSPTVHSHSVAEILDGPHGIDGTSEAPALPGVKQLTRAFNELNPANGVMGGGGNANTTPTVPSPKPLVSGNSFPGWVTFAQDTGGYSPGSIGTPIASLPTHPPLRQEYSAGNVVISPPSPAIPSVDTLRGGTTRHMSALEMGTTGLGEQAPNGGLLPSHSSRPGAAAPPLGYSMSAGALLPQPALPPRLSPRRSPLSGTPLGRRSATASLSSLDLSGSAAALGTSAIRLSESALNRRDEDGRAAAEDDESKRISTASDPFGDEHDLGYSAPNSDDETYAADKIGIPRKSKTVQEHPKPRSQLPGGSMSAGKARSVQSLAQGFASQSNLGQSGLDVLGPPAQPRTPKLVKPAFPPPPIPTSPSAASFAQLPIGGALALKPHTDPAAASSRSSHTDLHRSSPASSPLRPPLPPRPISPSLRPQPVLSSPQTGVLLEDFAPAVPARPVARAVEEALQEYAALSGGQSMATIPDTGLPTSAGPGGLEDRFAGLRREKLYSPDSVGTNRRLPVAEGLPNADVYLKHNVRCFAVSGFYACTGGDKNVRVWYIPTGDNVRAVLVGENAKISAMAYVPTRYVEDEGRFLWVSLEKGDMIEIDVSSGEIVDRKTPHSSVVTHILRYRGQMWTLDENGGLKMWAEDPGKQRVAFSSRPRSVRVAAKQTLAFPVNNHLWTAAGKLIEVYLPGADVATAGIPAGATSSYFKQRFDLSVTVGIGNINCFATTRAETTVFSGHDDGKVLVWDAVTLTKKRIVNVGMYPVTALLGIGDKYLWAGHSTGKIHVYDIEKVDGDWTAIKEFQAYHSAAVDALVMDERSVFLASRLQVASFSHHGQIRMWDGFLSRDWLENQLRLRESEWCTYRDLKLLVCSWNLDASKPSELDESRNAEDNTFLVRWLGSTENPDIIVVGFQELVDLESKKVTAKQLLKGTKKSQQSHMDHRFKMWREALIKGVRDAHPKAGYRLLECRQLVGLFQCVFIRESEGAKLKDVAVDMVKTGLKGYHGNKGGITTRFVLDDSSFCFVNTHLAAHQNQVSARNNDVATILKDAHFPPRPAYEGIFIGGGDGSMVLDHENVFWSGDLNYRIDLARERVIELVAQGDWITLQDQDQLLNQMKINPAFGLRGFFEGPLDFAPTFKYDVGTDRYDTSEKRRVPSWCDRVLYSSPHARLLHYTRHEAQLSDHRPISASFTVRVKSVNPHAFRPVKTDMETRMTTYLQHEIDTEKVRWLANVSGVAAEEARRVLDVTAGDLRSARDWLAANPGQVQQCVPPMHPPPRLPHAQSALMSPGAYDVGSPSAQQQYQR